MRDVWQRVAWDFRVLALKREDGALAAAQRSSREADSDRQQQTFPQQRRGSDRERMQPGMPASQTTVQAVISRRTTIETVLLTF